MRTWSGIVLAGLLAACADGTPGPVVSSAPSGPDWHREVVFYELFVRSFQDSDADGIGDLRGLIRRLDYLAELGVGGLWLMPTYPSPLRDSGYDVADYQDVHPDYGDLADLDELLREAHRRNLKVFLDLVINHTSDQHGWFQDSRQDPDGPRGDWYVWADQPGGDCDESNVVFGEERWTLDPARGQYYFHQFFPTQPDLNFRSASLQEALLDMVRFWLDRGVDGFRADVPHQYVENWPRCWHQPETYAFHRRLRAVLDEYPGRAMVAEACCTREEALSYLGSGRDAFHLVFYFEAMYAMYKALHGSGLGDLARALDFALASTPEGGLHANTLGNHDVLRTPTSIGSDPALLALGATAQLTLPGAPFVYYGEEIGLPAGAELIVDFRDWARTPMPWDDGPWAGFSTVEPWLALAGDADTINVADELAREGSLLHHYRRVIALRNATPALHAGGFERVDAGDDAVLAFLRSHAEGDRLVVLHFDPQAELAVSIPLPAGFAEAADLLDEISGAVVGTIAGGAWSATLLPSAGLVLRPAPY